MTRCSHGRPLTESCPTCEECGDDPRVATELPSGLPYLILRDPELTLVQRFKLVEIAATTTDHDVRRWALDTLERAAT